MNNGCRLRLSSVQQDVLFVLFALEGKGNKAPVLSMKLLEIINASRSPQLYGTNFRASCHKLFEHQFLDKYRCPDSLNLSWSLTHSGRAEAQKAYEKRQKQAQK